MISLIIILTVVALLGLKYSYNLIKHGLDYYIDIELDTGIKMFPYVLWGLFSIVYIFVFALVLIINYLP